MPENQASGRTRICRHGVVCGDWTYCYDCEREARDTQIPPQLSRTHEQIAKEYVDKQFEVMRKYGSLTKEISDREYSEIVRKIAALMENSR
jgi:hypothetical protein